MGACRRSERDNNAKVNRSLLLTNCVSKGEQRVESDGSRSNRQPFGFISASAVTFIVSVAATVYFSHSMCGEMEMPGGWTMSMMWMRMHGQTWIDSATAFLLMWLAMMVAMMLPSALPMFLITRRSLAETESPKLARVHVVDGLWILRNLAGSRSGSLRARDPVRCDGDALGIFQPRYSSAFGRSADSRRRIPIHPLENDWTAALSLSTRM